MSALRTGHPSRVEVSPVRGAGGAGTAQPGLQQEYRAALLARLRERARRRRQAERREDDGPERPPR